MTDTPCDLELEAQLLGNLLCGNLAAELFDDVNETDFYGTLHAWAFSRWRAGALTVSQLVEVGEGEGIARICQWVELLALAPLYLVPTPTEQVARLRDLAERRRACAGLDALRAQVVAGEPIGFLKTFFQTIPRT